MDNKEDLDATAQAVADAVRKAAFPIAWIIGASLLIAFVVVIAIPNLVLLVSEWSATR